MGKHNFSSLNKTYGHSISVSPKDVQRLRIDCKKLLVTYHPDLEKINFSDGYLFSIIIDYYLGNKY